jgi:hypothetical protein
VKARRLAAWAGSDRIPIVRARLAQLRALPVTRASAELALFVAGVDVDRHLLPALDQELASGDPAHAHVSILPIDHAQIVCDRADAPETDHLVCWPDDSSFHLLNSIPPGRRTTWLDLGCGSAVAQLARPALADRKIASDLNPRAVHFARLGATLSNVALEVLHGDLAAVTANLITCNAPIPDRTGPMWRATTNDLIPRLFATARAALAPGGEIIIHCAADAIPELSGQAVTTSYTPEPPHFAVTWWRPDAPPRQIRARRALTIDRPHLDHRDRDDALL